MKLRLDIDPDIVAPMAAEVAAGERAVTAAMREAGTSLKSAWRTQITGAGLGPRLANRSEARTSHGQAKASTPQRWYGSRPRSSSVSMTPARRSARKTGSGWRSRYPPQASLCAVAGLPLASGNDDPGCVCASSIDGRGQAC